MSTLTSSQPDGSSRGPNRVTFSNDSLSYLKGPLEVRASRRGVLLDGELLKGVELHRFESDSTGYIEVRDASSASQLLALSFDEILHTINIEIAQPATGERDCLIAASGMTSGVDGPVLCRLLQPGFADWVFPYTVIQFQEHARALGSMRGFLGPGRHEFDLYMYKPVVTNIPLRGQVEVFLQDFAEIESEAHLLSAKQVDSEVLVRQFSFPPEVRTACQQYLAYFVQFLRDLGVEAETGITESAGQTLLRVVPKDGATALAAVSEALYAYLALPGRPEVHSYQIVGEDPAKIQLMMNVQHLQTQLMMTQATVSIQATELALLKGAIPLHLPSSTALPAPTAEESRAEPLIDGVVSVEEIKVMGATFHLPTMLRKLKRRPSGEKRGG